MGPRGIPRALFKRWVFPVVSRWIHRTEERATEFPGALIGGPSSPERIDIPGRALALETDQFPLPGAPWSMPHMLGSGLGIRESVASLRHNPPDPRTSITEEELADLRAYAKSVGVEEIGFTDVDERWVFRDKAILHTHAIVLVMEMDKARMATAPSPDTAVMVHETYNALGKSANRIASWLREKGFSAHAGHPLGGVALYPPLAQQAGLGWRGIHGLIITPRFGPRVRLAAVFTSIENLPLADTNDHAWIEEFCDHCRQCVRECPADAIYVEPEVHGDGRVTCTDDSRCLPYFALNHGCSVCIKVCPFNRVDYERLHRARLEHGVRHAVETHTGP